MMLTRISDYLRTRGRASTLDLARGLEAEPDALAPMLGMLERKGHVRRVDGPRCGSCCKCEPAALEIYEWVGK